MNKKSTSGGKCYQKTKSENSFYRATTIRPELRWPAAATVTI